MIATYKFFNTDDIEKEKQLIEELHGIARKYDATFESHYSLDYPFIIRNVIGQNLEIADFGCGIGALAFYFAEHGHKVWAYDKHDLRWKMEQHPNIHFVHSDLMDQTGGLRMGGRIVKYFDYVIAASSIEHNQFKDIKSIVFEGLKILKPGGKFILSTECWRETKWAPLQGATCLGPKDIADIFETPIDFSEFDKYYGKFTNYPEWKHKCWEFLPYGIILRR